MQNAALKDSSLGQIWAHFHQDSPQAFLREACLPCQAGSAGNQLLQTSYKTSYKLKISLNAGRSAFFPL